MKLLFLNTNIGYGGASKILVWVANQCALEGHNVTLLTYRDNCVYQEIGPGVKHIHKHWEDGSQRFSILNTTRLLHQYINKQGFDAGIAFLSPSIFRMAIAAKGTKMRILFSQRGDPYFESDKLSLKTKMVNILNKWAFNQADYYVFQTIKAKEYYNNAIQQRSIVIPNPIRPMLRTQSRKEGVRKSFVAIGRLDLKQKRQDLLINAFNIISPLYPDFKLEIYGDGEDEGMIMEMAAPNPNIIIMGKTSDVSSAIQNAWATVLSSDFEGIPNILLESMSLGVPTISTDCSPGGASMLIRNKVNGLLVPRDDKYALANAMEYLIKYPEKAESMGRHAMEVNELYAEKVISGQWKTILTRLIK
ncbi:MAG: glycosyltransferase [Bacteroidales bacterium]|nr:glycosyltransferase [Bacteroidales bacterium]